MWGMFMMKAAEGAPELDFPVPPGIEFVEVNAYTGLPATATTPRVELISAALLPSQVDAVMQKAGQGGRNTPEVQFDPLDF